MQKFIVIRSHVGDKPYPVGSTRAARKSDVAHLTGKCLAEPGSPEAKAAQALSKKSKPAPEKKKTAAPKKPGPSTGKKKAPGRRKSKPKTAEQKARERRAKKKAATA